MPNTMISSHVHDHYTESGEHIISHDVQLSSIGRWLSQGWRDMMRAPSISLFYGAVMAFSVMMVYAAFNNQPVMMFKIATFFVMLSPFLATGLYFTAQKLEEGKKPTLLASMFSWRQNTSEITQYALVLGVIVAMWAVITPLIAAIVKSNALLIVDPSQGLMGFLNSEPGQVFLLYFFGLATLLTAFVFAISVVTIPLLLKDKNLGVIQAMILSYQVTMENKSVMAAWALTIGVLVTLGIVTLGLAMLVIMPLLGYASWHAFNDLIEIDDGYPAIQPS